MLEVNLLGALWTARAFLRSLAPPARAPTAPARPGLHRLDRRQFGERGHADYATAKAGVSG